MVHVVCFISLVLLKFTFIVDAEFKDKSHNFGDDVTEQTIAEPKKETDIEENNLKRLKNKITYLIKENRRNFIAGINDLHRDLVTDVSQHSASALKMVNEITAHGASREAQIGAIVTFITDVMSREIIDTVDLPPSEGYYGMPEYVCMSQGKASGLRSIKHSSTKLVINDDSLDLHVTYVLDNLYVHYGSVYVQILPWSSKRGALDIDFNKYEMELVLNLPRVRTLVKHVLRKNCIIRLKDFNVKDLEYSNARFTGYELLSTAMFTFLKMNPSMMKMKAESKVLEEVRRSLRKTGNFFCNDEVLADLILRKGGSLSDDVSVSDNFKLHCGSGKKVNRKDSKKINS